MSETPNGKRFDPGFLTQIVSVVAATVVFGWYPLMKYGSEQVIEGVAAGVALSVVNVLMGYGVIRFSMHRSYSTFIQIVLGGIAVRLFVMVGLLLVCVGLFRFHAVSLVGSLFVMYMVFLTLEVVYIHKKIQIP